MGNSLKKATQKAEANAKSKTTTTTTTANNKTKTATTTNSNNNGNNSNNIMTNNKNSKVESRSSSGSTSAAAPPSSSVQSSATNINESQVGDYSHFSTKLSIDDFELIKVLGKGSFGKVMLVKKKDDATNTLYAMKTLRKAALAKRNQLAHTFTERTILQTIHCPFLVHLIYAFQTIDKLYMVLDYMSGGELFYWLKKEKKFSENRCRLYAAEISLALEALHNADIVYRDLKPENILLDSGGHLRLADFGLAKSGITGPGAEGGTKTFCGTPEYLAPEILENKGHGKAIDWWALGTLLYEMLTGLPPFYDTNVQRMYHKIMHDPLKFPRSEKIMLSDGAKDILRRLLERKVSDRLGSGPTGANELKRTAFFQTLDFAKVLKKEVRPEFIPPLSKNEADVSNFDTEFTSEQPTDSLVVSHMSETMQDKTNFEGFTFQGETKLK